MIRKIATVTAFLCFSIFSCTKSDKTTPSMSATINNSAFSAIGSHVTAVVQSGMITVSGTNYSSSAANTIIVVTVPAQAGAYTFDSLHNNSNVAITLYSPDTNELPVSATSGQVQVKSVTDHSVQGTFSFAAHDGATNFSGINGQFSATY